MLCCVVWCGLAGVRGGVVMCAVLAIALWQGLPKKVCGLWFVCPGGGACQSVPVCFVWGGG
jgi:hypothetical protein